MAQTFFTTTFLINLAPSYFYNLALIFDHMAQACQAPKPRSDRPMGIHRNCIKRCQLVRQQSQLMRLW